MERKSRGQEMFSQDFVQAVGGSGRGEELQSREYVDLPQFPGQETFIETWISPGPQDSSVRYCMDVFRSKGSTHIVHLRVVLKEDSRTFLGKREGDTGLRNLKEEEFELIRDILAAL